MNTLQDLQFTDVDLLPALQHLSDDELDALSFGVIGIDDQAVVRHYNAYESRLAGLSRQRVMGHPLFTVVAPCMNNFMVAHRLEEAAAQAQPLDVSLDYVLTLRMRPQRVRLRLLAGAGAGVRWVLVHRPA